jgi:hypothetical protein
MQFFSILLVFFTSFACANDVDDALGKASKANATTQKATVDSSIYRKMGAADTDLDNKADSYDRKHKEFYDAANSYEDKQPEKKVTSNTKIWRCKVYCKSASGPITWQEVPANSRSEAAKWVGDNSDAICHNDGNGYSSNVRFSESQCSEK